jgi:hypothetical protein
MRSLFDQVADSGIQTFHEKIDYWIERALHRQVMPLSELLRQVPGVYPSEVIRSLRRLAASGRLPLKRCVEIETSARRKKPRTQEPGPTITNYLEHPLDFEWRFTHSAQMEIIKRLKQSGYTEDCTILLIGCPSLVRVIEDELPRARLILWDKNASTGRTAAGSFTTRIDLNKDSIPIADADVAVIDPPWYKDYAQMFLWAALTNLRNGGQILCSLPLEGTRPSAARDLSMFLVWCEEVGLKLLTHDRGVLSYRTPLFEFNALKAEGLVNVPLDWRRSGLAAFEKRKVVAVARPRLETCSNGWHETQLGIVRIKVLGNECRARANLLRPVGKTPVLPSVSTHYPVRVLANVVSSGNRFFRTSSPGDVFRFCELMSHARIMNASAEGIIGSSYDDSLPLSSQLLALALQEYKEATDYAQEIDDL